MLTDFIMTHSINETINIFNNYTNRTGIIPKIIQVTEFSPLYNIPLMDDNTIRASVFLPPYSSMQMLINNDDFNGFWYSYSNYLNSEIPEETIALIINYSLKQFLVHNNGLIIFHFENSDSGYIECILNHLYFKYGISLNIHQSNNYSYSTLSNIFNLLFLFNLISEEEFLNNVPKLPNGYPNVYNYNIKKLKK